MWSTVSSSKTTDLAIFDAIYPGLSRSQWFEYLILCSRTFLLSPVKGWSPWLLAVQSTKVIEYRNCDLYSRDLSCPQIGIRLDWFNVICLLLSMVDKLYEIYNCQFFFFKCLSFASISPPCSLLHLNRKWSAQYHSLSVDCSL